MVTKRTHNNYSTIWYRTPSSKLQFHLKAKFITLFQGDVWQFWNECWRDPSFQIDNSHFLQLSDFLGRVHQYWHEIEKRVQMNQKMFCHCLLVVQVMSVERGGGALHEGGSGEGMPKLLILCRLLVLPVPVQWAKHCNITNTIVPSSQNTSSQNKYDQTHKFMTKIQNTLNETFSTYILKTRLINFEKS